jgi:hypothetical protein
MKRHLYVLIGCLMLALAFGPRVPVAGARAKATALATGNVSGVVVNGTHQNAYLAGQKVILQRTEGNSTQDVATTVTDGSGKFSFTNLASNASDLYAAYTKFQGGLFSSQAVKLGSGGTALQLTVYDTTNDDTALRVSVATLLVRQPRPVNGLMGIGEIVTLENTGTTAFVGTLTGDASKPMRLLRFATPPNASDLSLGIGFDGSQVVTTDKGFGSTATVPPGTTDFAFSIDIPYTGTVANLSFKPVYPASRIVVLVPLNMVVGGRDFVGQGEVASLGSHFQVFTVANISADKVATLRLTGLPRAGETSYLDARALMIFTLILALLALAALLFYLRRGNIGTALGIIPATRPEDANAVAAHVSLSAKIEAGEHQRLLHEALSLEREFSNHTLTEAEFRKRDRAVRQQLRDLMANERSTSGARPLEPGVPGTEQTASAAGEIGKQTESAAPGEAAPEQSTGGRR